METKLKEIRKMTGYNQRQAASELGVTLGTYRNWEQGRVVMNAEQLVKTAKLFGTKVDVILGTEYLEPKKTASGATELLELYDQLDSVGKKALIACARGLIRDL
jgi:transcriptional regulator with XRE-family HTH domain